MKGEVNPIVGGIIIAVVLVVIGFLGFRSLHAGHYQMSPGGGPRKLNSSATVSPSSGGGAFKPSGNRPDPGHGMQGGGMMGGNMPTSSGGMNGGGQ